MAELESTRRGGSIRELRKRKVFAVLPSLLTLGNAVCGFGAITYAAKLGPEVASKEDLYTAALLIFGAMVCDALDGPLARLSRQTSDFGAQLDSLCDAISFGVAPAFLMLKSSFDHVFHPRILWVIAVLYMLCAILRLARFNVSKQTNTDHDHFSGLPSPAAAGMVASLVVMAKPRGLDQVDHNLQLADCDTGCRLFDGLANSLSASVQSVVQWPSQFPSPRAIDICDRGGLSGTRTSHSLDPLLLRAERTTQGHHGPFSRFQ